MRKMKQLRMIAKQAVAEGNPLVFENFVEKEDAKRKRLRAKQKASRKANRKKK